MDLVKQLETLPNIASIFVISSRWRAPESTHADEIVRGRRRRCVFSGFGVSKEEELMRQNRENRTLTIIEHLLRLKPNLYLHKTSSKDLTSSVNEFSALCEVAV